MAGIEVPVSLITLQRAVYAARLALVEHVRSNGSVPSWSDAARTLGASMQQVCEVTEAALQEAIAESGLEREHGRRKLRLALMAASAPEPVAGSGGDPAEDRR
ncbi:hypothetical protein PUR57_06835 [Streptomyces sp. JV176]|uniref:hypothetical protein n=1 Tax=unclassified Streptomyces TaxID=2593676 RepID=UPI002E768D33|nr:hypothetical protein [Streptomyces sp. JV176]MEE1798392.1 hypothetical protein [Streptomyces sp. JV176]